MKTTIAEAIALAVGVLPAGAAQAESFDRLYSQAKAEGALQIYGGGPARLYEGWVKEFEQKFPGIKVTGEVKNRGGIR